MVMRVSIDSDVITGYMPTRINGRSLSLGIEPRLRSGTVIYAGSVIGARLETGHNVIIREDNQIGDDVSIWSNAVIDYGCRIGSRVKIHAGCYVAQFTELEDDVFLAPGVCIANDLYPGDAESGPPDAGPPDRRRGPNRRELDDPAVRRDWRRSARGGGISRDARPAPELRGIRKPRSPHGTRSDLRDITQRFSLAGDPESDPPQETDLEQGSW